MSFSQTMKSLTVEDVISDVNVQKATVKVTLGKQSSMFTDITVKQEPVSPAKPDSPSKKKTTKMAANLTGTPTTKTFKSKTPTPKKVTVDQHFALRNSNRKKLDFEKERDVSGQVDDSMKQEIPSASEGLYPCKVCKCEIPLEDLIEHCQSTEHKKAEILATIKTERPEWFLDKNGVSITSKYDLPAQKGSMKATVEIGSTLTVALDIANTDAKQQVILLGCGLLEKCDEISVAEQTAVIAPRTKCTVGVKCFPKTVGVYKTTIGFYFEREKAEFWILRQILVDCKDDDTSLLKASEPYKSPNKVAVRQPGLKLVQGMPPPKSTDKDNLKQKIGLDLYFITPVLKKLSNHGFSEFQGITQQESDALFKYRDLFLNKLHMDAYNKRFSLLLHIEEIQMNYDIRNYDMHNVTMKKAQNPRLLALQVPGLAENRPSVLKGDRIFVTIANDNQHEYESFVHNVRMDEVWLGFSDSLMKKFVTGMKFDVRFEFNRFPLRLMHRAVHLAEEESLDLLLFPDKETAGELPCICNPQQKLVLFDSKLEKNAEQYRAVRHIVAGTSRPAPYIIFGPPGTGKSVTVVEAVKQLDRCIPSSHILVCAPSNSAADLLAQRLLNHIEPRKMFRMYSRSRPWERVPDAVRKVSNYDKMREEFYYPSLSELMKYRILITTMVTAGRLVSANFPQGHFTHVFIDEAGHAMEPEAVIAVASLLDISGHTKDGGQLVLAGDPHQLGPVLRSPFAINCDLGMSLLERLMKYSEIYQRSKSGYDSRFITKLVMNYRSHSQIHKVPSELFYDGELQTCADPGVRESCCRWSRLPRRGFPLFFHGVSGQDEREGCSPSFFNACEAKVVVDYVQDLLQARDVQPKVTESDIAIISPYRRQVEKIRKLLEKKRICDIDVASVEEFQGQERRVVIISTVRSSVQFLDEDRTYKLGFLRSPKRFNVAVTRAKALLIVVGNPNMLSSDPYWNALLQHCVDNGGYRGVKIEDSLKSSFDRIITGLSELQISFGKLFPISNISMKTLQEEPQWRDEA